MLTSRSQGTWQFLSIGLLKNSKKPHTILDDLESFLWVLMYMGLHYLEHTFYSEIQMFDEYGPGPDGGAIGGSKKRDFLETPTGKFASEPFQRLVTNLSFIFRTYHRKRADKAVGVDRKSTRLNSSHSGESRMPSSA